MWPVPSVEQLAQFSGRPVASYSSYASSALLQTVILFTTITENDVSDYGSMDPNDQVLATQGILAYADWTYLRQPYQAAIASPMMSETIGSYSYSKPPPVQVRNVQAQELGVASTGVVLWDTAVQYLSKRQRANGVFFGQVRAFDVNRDARYDGVLVRTDNRTGEVFLLGPADFDRENVPGFMGSVNGEGFPGDPGVG
jgi:hypothetical protein